ncbi:3D domain-containing protein [Candidatus Uhrbacteria bacterium]|nr:3D domain-containing protein [Candidatus Uhrbacteria bacterium]
MIQFLLTTAPFWMPLLSLGNTVRVKAASILLSVAVFLAMPVPAAFAKNGPVGLPDASDRTPRKMMEITATAYNSLPEQTDDTPFITASGTRVRHGVLATNALPFGTRVRMPELYGEQVFVVEDRMNSRYHKRMDIWMEDVEAARAFGIQRVKVEIY